MPALTFDDLLETGPTPARSGPLTFDDLLTESKPEARSYLDYAKDIGRGVVNGLDRGAAGIASAPVDLARAAVWTADRLEAARSGRPYEEVRDSRDATAPIPSTVLDRFGAANTHDNSMLRMDPETAAGRAADTVSSFVPGAVLTGGVGSVRGALAQVAAPAAGTLGARGANSVLGIEGTPAALLEGAGALAGGIGGMAALRPRTAGQTVARAVGELDPAVYQQAQTLMDDAARMGVRLTGDEAIQQVTGGATRLSDLRRVVENSRGGGDVLKPLMAERPAQVQAAGRANIDAMAPQPLDPTQTGLRVNRAAAGEIADTQTAINAATRPAYQAAEAQTVGPQVHGALMSDPLYAQTFNEVRSNPALNRTIEHLPADSVGVIDLVQRRMRETAENARVPGQANSGNLIAGNFEDARTAPIAAAERVTGGPQGSYATARDAQARLRQTQLEPLTEGPVGRLSGTNDPAAQSAALLPTAPKFAGAEAGVADAVRRVAARDPEAAQSLIRGHVRSAFDEATQDLASGANQFGGSKFASIIAGNTQQSANLEAAVRALPQGDQRWEGFRRMLDVMEATGKRPQVGSATAFNQEIQRELKQGGIVGDAAQAVKTGGTSLIKRFNEFKEQMDLGRNTTQIANLLSRPDSARVLGQLARTPPTAARAQILALRLSYMGRQGSTQQD